MNPFVPVLCAFFLHVDQIFWPFDGLMVFLNELVDVFVLMNKVALEEREQRKLPRPHRQYKFYRELPRIANRADGSKKTMIADMNDGNIRDDASHATHINEANIQKDRMNTPPPPYSLTNACLPPLDTQQKRWPPEPPPPFEGFPAYPAGPKLQKTEYPRNVPGPTYACPHCEGTFLYHRPNGLVECPFCYATISVGHYVRLRALSQVLLGLLLLLGSISFFTIIAMGMSSSQNYFFIAAALIALWALILLMRAARLRSNCKEAERIEF